MAIALVNQLDQWRVRLAGSRLAQFLDWWLGELRELLPPVWRDRLAQRRRSVELRLSDSELTVAVVESGTRQELTVLPVAEDARLHQQKIRELLQERELLEAPRVLLLAGDDILRKEIVLPLAAEAGLAQALAYEMDRQTPFRSDQVFYAFRILRRDREAGQLRAELLLTPRETLLGKLELLAPRGMAPSAVDIAAEGSAMGVNLLPPDMRFRTVNWRNRINWMLAGAAVLLLAGVMLQSIWLRSHQVDAVERAIEDVRAEAMRVQQIREQITDAREAAGFMAARRAAAIPTVKVVVEVTRLLPDDTYLDRLMIGEGSVQMQGKSSNAQRLIELINQSPYFSDAAFRGPTRLDSRSGREIFDLTANTTLESGS